MKAAVRTGGATGKEAAADSQRGKIAVASSFKIMGGVSKVTANADSHDIARVAIVRLRRAGQGRWQRLSVKDRPPQKSRSTKTKNSKASSELSLRSVESVTSRRRTRAREAERTPSRTLRRSGVVQQQLNEGIHLIPRVNHLLVKKSLSKEVAQKQQSGSNSQLKQPESPNYWCLASTGPTAEDRWKGEHKGRARTWARSTQ
ncbi:hypothetical protein PF005_g17978 [Phytophthora fragariae]|uniref:Uncharacterized protein n=1 Tax=Phytophthora fragariae TaxID=53985 RepID=A0A6A3Y2X9_9STRA|nr:hypothetical protein PF003_g16806 [Phytophthora fragariae]KAE8930959.1 hypothetical protein PF009_g18968 [Phytophthora fragariae]KAE9095631.1 hypothetical protein PF007_g17310 [Phytophthora fragariae]KAE9128751.1 hypothetical protein PF006_g16202 [Phytophthora fragariae]KAE9193694.1 hypothetical protein PF005_g17978 [Phytophthora fragariae]